MSLHSHKFLYMTHCWSNKGHIILWKWKRLQREICILLKLKRKIRVLSRVAIRLWNIFLFEFSVLKINPRWKNYISSYIWQRSFIQTVKCSFLDEKFVYQSFYDAPFKFGYFLLQGKVLCFAHVSKLLARCLLSKAFPRPCRKNFISAYIWIKSFIQTVKCSFVKVPISSKFLFSYLILYLTEWTSAKEKFDLDKM